MLVERQRFGPRPKMYADRLCLWHPHRLLILGADDVHPEPSGQTIESQRPNLV